MSSWMSRLGRRCLPIVFSRRSLVEVVGLLVFMYVSGAGIVEMRRADEARLAEATSEARQAQDVAAEHAAETIRMRTDLERLTAENSAIRLENSELEAALETSRRDLDHYGRYWRYSRDEFQKLARNRLARMRASVVKKGALAAGDALVPVVPIFDAVEIHMDVTAECDLVRALEALSQDLYGEPLNAGTSILCLS